VPLAADEGGARRVANLPVHALRNRSQARRRCGAVVGARSRVAPARVCAPSPQLANKLAAQLAPHDAVQLRLERDIAAQVHVQHLGKVKGAQPIGHVV
jgi:hypothetical protein